MADRKFLSSTEALGIGLGRDDGARTIAGTRAVAAQNAGVALDSLLIKWGSRIATALAEGPLPISEVVARVARAEGSRFDLGRFTAALEALQSTGAVEPMTTADGPVCALTEKGRELV